MTAPTLRSIERDYPHRIDADPTSCPVCCGDGETDDKRYGSEVVGRIDMGGHNDYDLYRCEACAVWADRARGWVGAESDYPVFDCQGCGLAYKGSPQDDATASGPTCPGCGSNDRVQVRNLTPRYRQAGHEHLADWLAVLQASDAVARAARDKAAAELAAAAPFSAGDVVRTETGGVLRLTRVDYRADICGGTWLVTGVPVNPSSAESWARLWADSVTFLPDWDTQHTAADCGATCYAHRQVWRIVDRRGESQASPVRYTDKALAQDQADDLNLRENFERFTVREG